MLNNARVSKVAEGAWFVVALGDGFRVLKHGTMSLLPISTSYGDGKKDNKDGRCDWWLYDWARVWRGAELAWSFWLG